MVDIKYLVFSGGGAAGYAHGGAIEQLGQEPDFSFAKIEGVAGASVGAIAAFLVSLNFSPAEIQKKLAAIDLKKLEDGGNIPQKLYRLFTEYGLYKGDVLYQLILDLIKEKTGRNDPQNFSFADLKQCGFKDLYIVATKIYKENNKPIGKEKIFSFEKTPNTSVAAAILASTAAPGYFRRVRLKKVEKGKYILDKNGDLFDDGGIVNNFPIDIFDKPKFIHAENNNNLIVNPHTLGLALLRINKIENETQHIVKSPIQDNHPLEYAVGVFNTLLLRYQKENLEKSENRKRTIQIDKLNVSLGDFGMDEQTKLRLIESGKKAVKTYFESLHQKDMNIPLSHNHFAIKPVNIGKMWAKPSAHQDVPLAQEEETEDKKYAII